MYNTIRLSSLRHELFSVSCFYNGGECRQSLLSSSSLLLLLFVDFFSAPAFTPLERGSLLWFSYAHVSPPGDLQISPFTPRVLLVSSPRRLLFLRLASFPASSAVALQRSPATPDCRTSWSLLCRDCPLGRFRSRTTTTAAHHSYSTSADLVRYVDHALSLSSSSTGLVVTTAHGNSTYGATTDRRAIKHHLTLSLRRGRGGGFGNTIRRKTRRIRPLSSPRGAVKGHVGKSRSRDHERRTPPGGNA